MLTKALFRVHVYFPSCRSHSSGKLPLSLFTIPYSYIQPSGCSWTEYREMVQFKPLEHNPSKTIISLLLLFTFHVLDTSEIKRDQSISLRNTKLGQRSCLWFTAHGCGYSKDRQGRKREQVQMEIASVELPSPLSSDCSAFFTAFGPCKAGTSDLITQQLYLTTLSLSL